MRFISVFTLTLAMLLTRAAAGNKNCEACCACGENGCVGICGQNCCHTANSRAVRGIVEDGRMLYYARELDVVRGLPVTREPELDVIRELGQN